MLFYKITFLQNYFLGFQFRTYELDGLILYHGVQNFVNYTTADYIAFELIDGHLFVVINLGSGHIRLQVYFFIRIKLT